MYQNKLREICEEPLHNIGFVDGFNVGGNCIDKSLAVRDILLEYGYRVRIVESMISEHRMNVISFSGNAYVYDASLLQLDLCNVTNLVENQEFYVANSFSENASLKVSKENNLVSVNMDLGNNRVSSLQNNTYDLTKANDEFPSCRDLMEGRPVPPVLWYRYFDQELKKQRAVIMVSSSLEFRFGFALEGDFIEENSAVREVFTEFNGFTLKELKKIMQFAVIKYGK